jgi:tetratricopeptide (TPR) repeat protein
MRSKLCLTTGFQFPFHQKPFVVWIFLLVLLCSSAALAGDDIRQADTLDARDLIRQAEKLTRKGAFTEAEKILRRVIERYPQESKAKLNLAYILLKQRRLVEAYDSSYPVAKAEPQNPYAFAVLGVTYLAAGNFNEAKVLLINSLQLNRREALAWAGLGMLDYYENRIFDSIANLSEAIYLNPREPDFLFIYAQVSARAENYKEAADAYRRFLQISPETDNDRRDRIKGLIKFLQFLGTKQSLYNVSGGEKTSVPVNLVNDRPVIELRVNKGQEPLRFVLDTGSGISVISEETAERLKIKPVARGGMARGVGGEGKFEIVYGFLKLVEVGNAKISSVPVYIRKFHNTNEKVDGYIGLSLISKFLTTIDYGNHTFSLLKKDSVSAKAFEKEAVTLPLRLTSSGFLSGEVQLEGVKSALNFIVDTGASISVISDDVAGLEGIRPFIRDEKMRVVGAAGITEDVPLFLLPKVTFGSHAREQIRAIALDLDVINESTGFEQAGILGGNFLKNYRVTFDFQNSKVTFVPIEK